MTQVIVEISYFPLTADYETLIRDFISRLRGYAGVEVTLNQTATTIQGEYSTVFRILETECKKVLSHHIKSGLVLKILNTR